MSRSDAGSWARAASLVARAFIHKLIAVRRKSARLQREAACNSVDASCGTGRISSSAGNGLLADEEPHETVPLERCLLKAQRCIQEGFKYNQVPDDECVSAVIE